MELSSSRAAKAAAVCRLLLMLPVPDNAHRIGVGTTSGATITATEADGTRYTLTIPANALLARQVINVTPPTTIGELPLSGSLVGDVQLASDTMVCTRRRR